MKPFKFPVTSSFYIINGVVAFVCAYMLHQLVVQDAMATDWTATNYKDQYDFIEEHTHGKTCQLVQRDGHASAEFEYSGDTLQSDYKTTPIFFFASMCMAGMTACQMLQQDSQGESLVMLNTLEWLLVASVCVLGLRVATYACDRRDEKQRAVPSNEMTGSRVCSLAVFGLSALMVLALQLEQGIVSRVLPVDELMDFDTTITVDQPTGGGSYTPYSDSISGMAFVAICSSCLEQVQNVTVDASCLNDYDASFYEGLQGSMHLHSGLLIASATGLIALLALECFKPQAISGCFSIAARGVSSLYHCAADRVAEYRENKRRNREQGVPLMPAVDTDASGNSTNINDRPDAVSGMHSML